eukprot:c14372_g1_i1.p1 GENE.c14372_g1_i1~~c14372_g1_i1.p1  ORF type:complete len:235 (-),score=70.60 c14372_g1_i1:18-722(-)
MMRANQLFSIAKRGFTTTRPQSFRRVGIQYTRMELISGKWTFFSEQVPQIAREVDQFPGILRGGVYYAIMNLGTKPGLQTDALSLVVFDTAKAAEDALVLKPKTRTELQSIMKSVPRRDIYDGIFLKEAKKSEADAYIAAVKIETKPEQKQECLKYLQDKFVDLGPSCEWICVLSSPSETETTITVLTAFASYDNFKKIKSSEASFLTYLSKFATNTLNFECYDKSAFYTHIQR